MNKTKILLTTGIFPPEVGGPATYSALLVKELPRFGIDVEVLPFSTVRHFPKIIRHFMFFVKVLKRGVGKDLLYTQDTVSAGFPTVIASKILRKPFLIRVPGDYAWEQSVQRFAVHEGIDDFQNKKYGWKIEFLRKLQALTVRYADRAITPSKYFRNLVAKWNPKKNNVVAIYNGINFADIPLNAGIFEPKTIISAGRLVPWKGFDSLIEMMQDLPDWKLFIAGDGPDKARLSNLITDLGLQDQVFMLGNLPRLMLIKKIQDSELFILNTSFESFSFQIVEAMFAGIPVISTDIGNISEIIDDGQDGILVAPNDKKAIIGAIHKLEDKGFRLKIIAGAKKKAEMFGVESTLKKTTEVIFSLIKK